MNAMNCHVVSARLSEFMDGELDSVSSEQISLHIDSCATCRNELDSYHRLTGWMRVVETPVDMETIWNRIESALPTKVRMNASWSLKRVVPALALAASLGFFMARFPWFSTNETSPFLHEHSAQDHESLAVDFRQVIQLAQSDPQQAISHLIEKYDGLSLDAEAATKYIGYQPSLFSNVPDGFQRISTHVLNMPCCKCSATVCQRSDGRSLIVFEHKDEQPLWFADLPSIEIQCSGTKCRIMESAGQLAVSWRQRDRQYTIIGATELAEVNEWVDTMKL